LNKTPKEKEKGGGQKVSQESHQVEPLLQTHFMDLHRDGLGWKPNRSMVEVQIWDYFMGHSLL
jgi:hypothetical protein